MIDLWDTTFQLLLQSMRLLHIGERGELSLTDDLLDNVPPYTILSHTWGADYDEVTFDDMKHGHGKNKAGYAKLHFCQERTRKEGVEYCWVDTCCIDKANHVELSTAITSMYWWYRDAKKCYVYLSDVLAHKRDICGQGQQMWESAFRTSQWFKRGWTLQELLAPASVEFFSREGELLGNKGTLEGLIYNITQIPTAALRSAPLTDFSFEERWRWVVGRQTKKIEDKAYCLLGIFDVSMSLRYGQGEKEFQRLKDKVYKMSGEPILPISITVCDVAGKTDLMKKSRNVRSHQQIAHSLMGFRCSEATQSFCKNGFWSVMMSNLSLLRRSAAMGTFVSFCTAFQA